MNPEVTLRGPDPLDTILLVLFMLGIYLGIEIRLSSSVPIPNVVAGTAGMLLVLKQLERFNERHVWAILLVLLLYLASICAASDYAFLSKRFTGLLQLTYSFVICYAVFVTILLYDRVRLARIFLILSLAILVGCALENYVAAFRDLSDWFRNHVYSFGLYESDARDQVLYGRIRPKLFTSEPSAVTFGFTLFAFAWYVLSLRRGKLFLYGAMFAVAFYLMRGPTLVLGLALVPAYEIFLAARMQRDGRTVFNPARICATAMLMIALAGTGVYLSRTLYAERIDAIQSGADPSFFARIVAPPIVARMTVERYPIAGAGLTGEPFIADTLRQVYAQSPDLANDWDFGNAIHALANYFWSQWIYLGAVWGVILLIALSFLLRELGAASIAFCWIVWSVFGQASGAYVSPKTWTVFFLGCALSILHERQRLFAHARGRPEPFMPERGRLVPDSR
jgi:hypothetical protein